MAHVLGYWLIDKPILTIAASSRYEICGVGGMWIDTATEDCHRSVCVIDRTIIAKHHPDRNYYRSIELIHPRFQIEIDVRGESNSLKSSEKK